MFKSKLMNKFWLLGIRSKMFIYDIIKETVDNIVGQEADVVDSFLKDVLTFLLMHEDPKSETMTIFDFKEGAKFCKALCIGPDAPLLKHAKAYPNTAAAIIHSCLRITNRQTHDQGALTAYCKLMTDLGIARTGSWKLENNVQSFNDTAFIPGEGSTPPTIELNL